MKDVEIGLIQFWQFDDSICLLQLSSYISKLFFKKFDDTKLEMQIFNNEREYPRMFSEVIEVFYVVACIYVKKNWMKEDIRRKVTNKLFFSLHFLLEQDLTVLLNALSFHLGQYIFKWLVVKVHCNAIKKFSF